MPGENKCPQCGTPLPAGALAGLCPACLLKQGAAAETATGGQAPPFNPPSIAELAPLFPQLEILELIGKGGMGAVYKARQKELDRVVALKILPPGIGEDPAFAGRFAREARALAKLNHPGIVTLYEFGVAAGASPAVEPGILPGGKVAIGSDRVENSGAVPGGKMPPSTSGQRPDATPLYYFLMEFVDGMNLRQLLHAGRIAPREALAIVPQICDALQFAHDQGIVHRDIKPENILLDRRGRVKVADFGLVKLVGTDAANRSAGLRPGASSEDDSHEPGQRPALQELTAAGKVMGTPQYMAPEQKEHPDAVDHRADIYALGMVFYQMLTGELPGKKIEPPSSKVQIDVRLDEVVLRALETKPERRYQQASEVKTMVETIATTPPGGSPQVEVQTISAAAQAGGGWKIVVGVAAGVAAAIIFVAILGLVAAVAIPNFVRARRHSQQAAVQEWTRQGWQFWQAHKFAEAEAKFQQAVQLVPDDANAWNGLGWAQFNAGNGAAAEMSFQKAITIETNQPGALNGLGQIYLSQRKYNEAEKFLLQAAPRAPAAWFGLARLYLLEGNFEQAEKWAQDIVDSGQADETAKKMLEAAKAKKLSGGLRLMIEPSVAKQTAAKTNETSVASAETWSPTLASDEQPDLQIILNAAKSLTAEGSYEEALQHYLWYFNHSRNDAGQRGVRLSFALSDWVELGRRYPKAKQALMEIRDAEARQFSEGAGYFDLFQEIAGINQYLNDTEATLALFKVIEQRDRQLAGQCYPFVQGLLVQQGEYAKCLGYLGDPQAAFERIRDSRERMKNWEDQQANRREQDKERLQAMAKTNPAFAHFPPVPEPPPFADNHFVGQTRELIEILVGAGRKSDAEIIRDEALSVLDDVRIKSAVSDADAKVKK
ncbi:MAG: protein kinase [Verrucomicrobiota bacterium]